MKSLLSVAVATAILSAASVSPAFAVDFEYFKSQTCPELSKELVALQKAEKETNDNIKKANGKANATAVVTTLLVGWPFWGDTDHGDNNNILAEIRADVKMITRAQKVNKCSA